MKKFARKYAVVLIFPVVLLLPRQTRAAGIFTIENEKMSLTFDCNKDIHISRIVDKGSNFNFLTGTGFFFSYSINHDQLRNAVVVTENELSADHRMLKIVCHPTDLRTLKVTFLIQLNTSSNAAIISTSVQNESSSSVYLKFVLPDISNLTVPGFDKDSTRMLGMIPQEIGEVVTMNNGLIIGTQFFDSTTQLPTAFNVMEVANLFDREGSGGVFFADLDGNVGKAVPSIQFLLSQGQVSGHWASLVKAHKTLQLSRLAIGINKGDYHESIDLYTKYHRPDWKFPDAPTWFREAGAIWSTVEEGSGGAYEIWPAKKDLRFQISSFNELPKLYQEAVDMGTNIFYLNDYWEGDGKTIIQYLNKGDYIPRSDLGGAEALINGIKEIHARGGKVIMYVEPFIMATSSKIGQTKGTLWAARNANDVEWVPYGGNYVVAAANTQWHDHIVKIAQKLVGEYGADGIFLDSWGWRYNLSFKNREQNIMWSGEEWNKGVHDLTDKVLAAVRAIKKDAIVVSESAGGQMALHENGGLSADFVWGSSANEGRIIASPVRYGMPEVHFFSNGTTLNQLIQVFAAGHGLALNDQWIQHAAYIRELLDIRRIYKDALIYGNQTYQPRTGTLKVGAYFYEGRNNKVITLANVDTATLKINLQLHESEKNTVWSDALTGEMFAANGTQLSLYMLGSSSFSNGLRVLIQNHQ